MKMTKKEKWAFGAYILQAVLQIVGLILLFAAPLERQYKNDVFHKTYLIISDWRTFKWFTTDSNIAMLIICLIAIVLVILKLKGKIKKIPMWFKVTQLVGTSALVLTMLVILGFTVINPFLPQTEMTLKGMYMNSNAFHHIICPVFAIVSFLLFWDSKDVPLKKTLYCLIPIIIYGIFYMVMAYTHMNADGTFMEGYDWYTFCHFGPVVTPFVAIGVVGGFYLINWLMWLGNRKIYIKALEKKTR